MCQPQLFETGRGTPSLHLDCEMAQEDKIGHMEMILVHSGTYKPLQVSQTESYLNQEIKRPSLGAEGAKNGKLGSFQRSETPESHSNLEGGNSLLSPYSSALTQYVGSRRLRFCQLLPLQEFMLMVRCYRTAGNLQLSAATCHCQKRGSFYFLSTFNQL